MLVSGRISLFIGIFVSVDVVTLISFLKSTSLLRHYTCSYLPLSCLPLILPYSRISGPLNVLVNLVGIRSYFESFLIAMYVSINSLVISVLELSSKLFAFDASILKDIWSLECYNNKVSGYKNILLIIMHVSVNSVICPYLSIDEILIFLIAGYDE